MSVCGDADMVFASHASTAVGDGNNINKNINLSTPFTTPYRHNSSRPENLPSLQVMSTASPPGLFKVVQQAHADEEEDEHTILQRALEMSLQRPKTSGAAGAGAGAVGGILFPTTSASVHGARSPALLPLLCPHRHPLVVMVDDPAGYGGSPICDLCSRSDCTRRNTAAYHHCAQCGYDLCGQCEAAQRARLLAEAEAEEGKLHVSTFGSSLGGGGSSSLKFSTPSKHEEGDDEEEEELPPLLSSPQLMRENSIPGMRFRNNEAFRAMHSRVGLEDAQLVARLCMFTEQNKVLLNTKLKQHVRLLERSLLPLLLIPDCRKSLDFAVKRKYFELRLKRLKRRGVNGDQEYEEDISLEIDRSKVLENSFECFRNMSPASLLRGRMDINFENEEGIDAGGLTREWYGLVTREIFRPSYALFTPSSDGVTYQPQAGSGKANPEHLLYFKFVGQVIGKALADGVLLDVHFTRSFYHHMLGLPVSYHDLEAVDAPYYRTLTMILTHPLADLGLDLTFSANVQEFGRNVEEELLPGGCERVVTDGNKAEYVRLIAHHRMTSSLRKQIDAFLEGFHELVPSELVSIFDAQELELLVSGLPEIDIDDMESHCTYSGYSRGDPTISKFWSVLRRFSREEKALFVQFVTGTSKVPLDGFQALQGSEGVQMLSVHKAYDAALLPTAHTCFSK